jgi:hypothetical protein
MVEQGVHVVLQVPTAPVTRDAGMLLLLLLQCHFHHRCL